MNKPVKTPSVSNAITYEWLTDLIPFLPSPKTAPATIALSDGDVQWRFARAYVGEHMCWKFLGSVLIGVPQPVIRELSKTPVRILTSL